MARRARWSLWSRVLPHSRPRRREPTSCAASRRPGRWSSASCSRGPGWAERPGSRSRSTSRWGSPRRTPRRRRWWCGGPGSAESGAPSTFDGGRFFKNSRVRAGGRPFASACGCMRGRFARVDLSFRTPGRYPIAHVDRPLGPRKQEPMWIVRLALRRPYTIAVLCALIGIFGVLSASRMKTDILPAIDIPVVIVVWNYPGLSAEDMERRVVFISERAMSTTVSGITRIDSQSMSGIGILKVYFEPGSDIGGAIAQIVSVSLTASRIMPPGITPPSIIRYNASNVPVAQLTISSKTLNEQELYDYGLNFIRLRLFTIPGLATPAPFGGKSRQIMVDIDPGRVAAKGLSPNDVVQAVLASNVLVPAGSAQIGGTVYDVKLNSSPETVQGFNDLPVKAVDGATIVLGDVARVRDGYAVQENLVRIDGRRATYLAILKKADASTLAVVEGTREQLPIIKAAAPEGMELKIDFDQSVFVRAAIQNVLHEAVIASILVSLMILFFLGSWRGAVLVGTSIPLAILVGLVGLFLGGQTLNLMTLGGLALAIGMLVDDATVEVENIHRNRHMGKPLTVAILDGARQIAVPALAATLTICVVFFPVVLLEGPARFLFSPLALGVVISMLASYLLSRTLVPTLARILLEKENLEQKGPGFGARFNRWRDARFERFREAYGRALSVVLGHRGLVIGAAWLVLPCSAALPFG